MIKFFYDSYWMFIQFLISGIFLGIIYDIFRLFRIEKNKEAVALGEIIRNRYFPNKIRKNSESSIKKNSLISFWVFVEDIFFFLIVAITEILAIYHLNDGEIRIYCLLFSFIGFFCYQKTIGILLNYLFEKFLKLFKKILFICICSILDPTVFIIKKIKKLYLHWISRKKLKSPKKTKRSVKKDV